MMEPKIDDYLLYRGCVYSVETGRPQLIYKISDNGDLFTKFIDNGNLNVINVRSGYYELCDIIDKSDLNVKLDNGIPINWENDES